MQLARKEFISPPSLWSIIKRSRGTNSEQVLAVRTEAATVEEFCLLAYSSCPSQLTPLDNSELYSQSWHHPTGQDPPTAILKQENIP